MIWPRVLQGLPVWFSRWERPIPGTDRVEPVDHDGAGYRAFCRWLVTTGKLPDVTPRTLYKMRERLDDEIAALQVEENRVQGSTRRGLARATSDLAVIEAKISELEGGSR